MSNTRTAQQKGQKTGVKNSAPEKATTTPKVEKSDTKVDEILNPTAGARIKKLENFQLLAKKHRFLTNKRNELDKFIISSDGTKEQIILQNAEGYTFEVSNSQVIEKVVNVMGAELDLFLAKSEKDVLAFQI